MYEEASNSTIFMLLHTAVYPFLVALVVSFVAGKWSRAHSYIGYLGGFIVGLSLIHSGLSFPPKQAIDYYSVTAIIGIVSLICFTLIKPTALRLSAGFILFGVSFYCLLNPVLKHSGWLISLSWAAGSALIALIYLGLTQDKTDQSGVLSLSKEKSLSLQIIPISLMISAGAAAPVISIGGSLLIGQLLGALGAALFGYAVINYFSQSNNSNASIPALLLFGGLITQSHVLADIPLSVMLMLAASSFITPIATAFINNVSKKQCLYILLAHIIVSLLISGLGLWLVWPESSLY